MLATRMDRHAIENHIVEVIRDSRGCLDSFQRLYQEVLKRVPQDVLVSDVDQAILRLIDCGRIRLTNRRTFELGPEPERKSRASA